jgi:hypothetical protein
LKMVIVADYCETHGFRRDSREAKEFVPPIHDLTKLVTKAKLRINKADRETLGELTSFSVWRGKYPTPLSATAYTPAVLDASIGRERLWKRYDALYRKLHRLAVRKSFPEAIRAPRRAQARRQGRRAHQRTVLSHIEAEAPAPLASPSDQRATNSLAFIAARSPLIGLAKAN